MSLNSTIVLKGNGPHIKVSSPNGKPVKVLMVSQGHMKSLSIKQTTDVRFAA